MSILMINPNKFKPHVAPVGLEYVCNSLVREKIDFDLVDLNFDPEKIIYRKLRKNDVDLVGITVRNLDSGFLSKIEVFQPGIKKLINRIKNKKDCKVVLGGAGFSMLPREVMEYMGADFGVVGYGEEALPKLVHALRNGGDFSRIDNLAWRKNGDICINSISTGDYENIPVRRRNIIRNKSYYNVFGLGNIEIKRGCSRHCGYCSEPDIVGCRVVHRRIENVIMELKELKSLEVNHLYFCDSEFNVGSEEYSIELCKQIIENKIGVTWTSSIHPSPKMVSRKLLALMKEAGCTELLISMDSGSDEILADMGKGHTVEDAIICSDLIGEAGIPRLHTYLTGWRGESKKTLDETISLIKRCQPEEAFFFCGVRIYPGTKLSRIAREEGLINEESELRAPIFYQPERVLREFIPYLRRSAEGIPNCIIPTRAINLMNLIQRNVYLLGGFTGGLSDFVDRMNSLSLKEKLQIFGKTALDYVFPIRHRYIPAV
ncbi:MAG: radical SAM protein [Candidatus Aminicenantes bacterium]|nr:radical SAM protein [Candidatus Aminicenantes bacterium]